MQNNCGYDLVFVDSGGIIKSINLANGELNWTNNINIFDPNVLHCIIAIDVNDDKTMEIFVAGSKTKLFCLNPTNGNVIWSVDLNDYQIDGGIAPFSSFIGNFSIADFKLNNQNEIIFDYGNKLIKIDASTGHVMLVKEFDYPANIGFNDIRFIGNFDNNDSAIELLGVANMVYDTVQKQVAMIYCINSDLETLWTLKFENLNIISLIMADYNNDGCSDLIFNTPDSIYVYGIPNSGPCGTLRSPIQADFCVSSLDICGGECITLVDKSSGYPAEWEWDFEGAQPAQAGGNYVQRVCYPHPGEFTINMTASNSGYVSKVQKKVAVKPSPDYNLQIPNVLTPNNDGLNDALSVGLNKDAIQNFKFTIMNRWGNLVFSSQESNFEWNPIHENPGVYFWTMEYENTCGNTKKQKRNGVITVLDKD